MQLFDVSSLFLFCVMADFKAASMMLVVLCVTGQRTVKVLLLGDLSEIQTIDMKYR